METVMGKQYYPKPAGDIERDLNYTSRGRGKYLGDALPGYGDFKGDGRPEDNTQDNDVQGEGYMKKGTWDLIGREGAKETKSDVQP
jgi:hypothetical protein